MSAQDILKMIEQVDPADTAKLREIDALVAAYLFTAPFTRVRDALKAIRPKGWAFEIQSFDYEDLQPARWHAILGKDLDHDGHVDGLASPELPTEELAELYAIIQAIACEREAEAA